jgi:phytol kinase
MLVRFLVTCVIAAVFLVSGEIIRRRLGQGNEVSRKLVHITHGVCIAVWPFILGYWIVYVVEALFVVSVLLTYKLHWFRWLWRVGRKTWGEYMYPLGVVGAALLAHSKWIFLAGMLELAFADAAAALVGKRFGRGLSYKVFKQNKSIPGSAAFFVVSLAILGYVVLYGPAHFNIESWAMVAAVSFFLTIVENLGVYGVDNLFLPIATVALLNAL